MEQPNRPLLPAHPRGENGPAQVRAPPSPPAERKWTSPGALCSNAAPPQRQRGNEKDRSGPAAPSTAPFPPPWRAINALGTARNPPPSPPPGEREMAGPCPRAEGVNGAAPSSPAPPRGGEQNGPARPNSPDPTGGGRSPRPGLRGLRSGPGWGAGAVGGAEGRRPLSPRFPSRARALLSVPQAAASCPPRRSRRRTLARPPLSAAAARTHHGLEPGNRRLHVE